MTSLVETAPLISSLPDAKSAKTPFDKKEWRTPVPVFQPWALKWRFTVDAFASDRNSAGLRDSLVWTPDEERDCWTVNHPRDGLRPGQGLIHAMAGDWCYKHGHAVGRYLTKETNGLDPSNYHEGDRVWANPPYIASVIEPAVKLAKELALDGGIPWVLLLPPSVDTKWFRLLWNDRASRWRDGVQGIFPPGRIRFNRPDGTPGDSPRAGNLFVVLYAGGDA